jgi:putative glutamine amidotransferase
MPPPRIAIPVPTAANLDYNRRAWPQYAAAVTASGGIPVEIPLTDPPAATARLLATCHAILLPGSPADVNPQKYGQLPDPETNPADPARENVDELLLQDAHNLRKPILTICFGTQMLNVWRGGTLLQHLTPMPVNHAAGPSVAVAHTAVLAPNSLLASIVAETSPPSKAEDSAEPSPSEPALPRESASTTAPNAAGLVPRLAINSSHHQAIAIPGDGLRVTARSPEDAVIEAVELNDPEPLPPTAARSNPPGLESSAEHVENGARRFLLAVQWHPERTYSTDPASRALFTRFIAAASAWQPKPPTQP